MATANTACTAAKVTSATTGLAIATLTVNPGLYDVTVVVGAGANCAAADFVNMELQSDSAVSGTLVTVGALLTSPVASGTAISYHFLQVEALSTIQVSAVAGATSSAVYYASIVATAINQPTDEPPFFNTAANV